MNRFFITESDKGLLMVCDLADLDYNEINEMRVVKVSGNDEICFFSTYEKAMEWLIENFDEKYIEFEYESYKVSKNRKYFLD